MDKNKIIAEWLGWCWPEWESMSDDGICIVCGEISESHTKHDFTTWQGFGLLIEALREKDEDMRVEVYQRKDRYSVELIIHGSTVTDATAETLPNALIEATLDFIDREKTNGN